MSLRPHAAITITPRSTDYPDLPIGHSDIWNIGPGHVIASHALPPVVRPQPVVLGLLGEAAVLGGVPGQLAHVAAGELPDLGRDAVLLHEGLLGEVELEGVVSGEGDVEAAGEIVRQGGAVVVEEERVV